MEKRISFFKMTGSGNDFIIVDNRNKLLDVETAKQLAQKACRRKLSIGADGLILIENDDEVDFSWVFFNSDGSIAEMCGNGARCAARFCYLKGIVQTEKMTFRTIAGLIDAEVMDSRVKVKIPEVRDIELDIALDLGNGNFLPVHFINTGVPHVVVFLESLQELESFDVVNLGRLIRFHERFQPAGTNVNFVFAESTDRVHIRTYERGVEDETLACGTGSIAAAILGSAKNILKSPVSVHTRSGEVLKVYFEGENAKFHDVYLEGPALVAYEGVMWTETIE